MFLARLCLYLWFSECIFFITPHSKDGKNANLLQAKLKKNKKRRKSMKNTDFDINRQG